MEASVADGIVERVRAIENRTAEMIVQMRDNSDSISSIERSQAVIIANFKRAENDINGLGDRISREVDMVVKQMREELEGIRVHVGSRDTEIEKDNEKFRDSVSEDIASQDGKLNWAIRLLLTLNGLVLLALFELLTRG